MAVAPGADNQHVHAAAVSLAEELTLPLSTGEENDWGTFDLMLVVTERRLELREAQGGRLGPISVDFLAGTGGYRRRTARTGRQLIARAVGLRGEPLRVLDATAGLGSDAFLLACLGCTVVAVERSPVIAALLRDGLARAAAHPDTDIKRIAERVSLITKDARDVMKELAPADTPDVVYLDPMYPPKKKSALAKKEMRMCRLLVGDDDDAGDLLDVARGVARRRVVVKRLRHAPPLAPDHTAEHIGRTVRYDVYQPRTQS